MNAVFETLERRSMMSVTFPSTAPFALKNGVLYLTGSPTADVVNITISKVKDSGFRYHKVMDITMTGGMTGSWHLNTLPTAIAVQTLGGDDRVTIDYANYASIPATVLGGIGNDSIVSDAGSDSLVGEGGSDTIYGGAGDDRIEGGKGADELHGDAGNDTLVPGPLTTSDGADNVFGGIGIDTVDYSMRTDDLGIVLDDSPRSGSPTEGDTLHSDIENANGGWGNDTIIGNALANDLVGNAKNDTIHGGGGRDTLEGGDGNDELHGEGTDGCVFYGGANVDKIFGTAGNDVFHTVDGKTDFISRGGGVDDDSDTDAQDWIT